MSLFALLPLAINRLRNRIALTILLTITSALSIAIAVCIPLFTDAVGKQVIREQLLERSENQQMPLFPVRFLSLPRLSGTMTLDEYRRAHAWLSDKLQREMNLPILFSYLQHESSPFYLLPRSDDLRYEDKMLDLATITLVLGIEEHIHVVEGAPFGMLEDRQYLNVWVEQAYAAEQGFQVGDSFILSDPRKLKGTLLVRIAGIWQAIDPESSYWHDTPAVLFKSRLLTSEDQFQSHVMGAGFEQGYREFWFYVLDNTHVNLLQAERYINVLTQLERELEKYLPTVIMTLSPRLELGLGQARRVALSAVLFCFTLPLISVLWFFTFSVSNIVVRYQQQEVAILASRGSSRKQILYLASLEALAGLSAACPLGIFGGKELARLMGYARGFLSFVPTTPPDVHLASMDWNLVGTMVVLCMVARLLPAWSAARLTVVTYERNRSRQIDLRTAFRLSILTLLTIVTGYAYYRLRQVGSLTLIGLQPDDQTFDPITLLAPSLFLLTMSLLAAESFGLFMRPLPRLGLIFSSPPVTLAAMGLGRDGQRYRAPLFMLVICLSLGVFFASLAKSADTWNIDRRKYEVGCDLAFHPVDISATEALGINLGVDTEDTGKMEPVYDTLTLEVGAVSLPAADYTRIQGVEAATALGNYEALLLSAPQQPRGRLMALDRLGFAQVAYYRPDFSSKPLGELLNRLGANPDGVLIPSHLSNQLGLDLGDTLQVRVLFGEDLSQLVSLTIVGTVDYFPTMYNPDDIFLVANLEYLQTVAGGTLPWSVWTRLSPDADWHQVRKALIREGVVPAYPRVLRMRVQHDQAKLERVGMMGMLSLCFLTGAALAGIGLLVYLLTSTLGRTHHFAVWRALGIQQTEVIRIVLIEYLALLLYGLGAGLFGGMLACSLYVPLFRLIDSPAVPIPPFIPTIDWERAVWMSSLMGLTLAVIIGAILMQLMRMHVFEALRLGTRE